MCRKNAKGRIALIRKGYRPVKKANGDRTTNRRAACVSRGELGSVNYWLLIACVVLLIVIFGAPLLYRTSYWGKDGGSFDTDTPAQQAISHNKPRRISEKIVKRSKRAEEGPKRLPPSRNAPLEDQETSIINEKDKGPPVPEGETNQEEVSPSHPKSLNDSNTGVENRSQSGNASNSELSDEALKEIPGKEASSQFVPSEEKAPAPGKSETHSPGSPEVLPPANDQERKAEPGNASQRGEQAESNPILQKKSDDIRYVIVEMGNVRENPSIDAAIKFRIKHGDAVNIRKKQGNWFAIRLDDERSGWVHRSLLSRIPPLPEDSDLIQHQNFTKEIRAVRPITAEDQTGVIFELNGYFSPKTKVLEGDRPRLICDFPDTRIDGDIPHYRELKGGYIQRIRIGIHHKPRSKVRVVLDFRPGQDYAVEQVFYKKNNYYTLIVKPRK
jgi:hypothetical protein